MDPKKLEILKDFIRFCKKELNIQSLPKISMVNDTSFVEDRRSFGEYNPGNMSIKVFYLGRNLADVCRSLAHELTHHRQSELDLIYTNAGETGTDVENDANAMAGILMREYGRINPGVYDLQSLSKNLNEAKQVGTLYHFTNYVNMIGIINSKFVLTTNQIQIQPYVSFTRNKNLNPDSISTDTRLTVDGNKLSDRYKISPHADTKAGYGRSSVDESEERISLLKYPEGVDVSKFILAIDIKKPNYNVDYDDEDSYGPPSLLNYEKLIKTLQENNIKFNLVDNYK